MILSTHISAVVFTGTGSKFDRKVSYDGNNYSRYYLAAMQRNLSALQPFQIDAGLESGIGVLEAAPTKSASTAVHPSRLELRHQMVGVVDPRIDVIAALRGLEQVIDDTVPRQALNNTRFVSLLRMGPRAYHQFHDILEDNTYWDTEARQFVVPAHFETNIWSQAAAEVFDRQISVITGGETTRFDEDNAKALRQLAASARIQGGKITFAPGYEHAARVNEDYRHVCVNFSESSLRVLPDVRLDSPAIHLERRANALKSSTVSNAFGQAKHAVISATESVQRRLDLIRDHMVVTKD